VCGLQKPIDALPWEGASLAFSDTLYYLDQLHVKSEHWLPWRFQMPFDISNEGGQSTTTLTSFM